MIKTGNEPITVKTYIAILAVCFIINLPGVAIAPVEGKLREMLHTSELTIQLLTVLPNFMVIPFVLLSGKLSEYKHKAFLILISLIVYVGCGVSYLLCNSITGLIITSCILGCADGVLIPFAMGFVVNTFEGKYRTRQLGIKSMVSNLGVLIASFIIGFLVESKDWHLPFCVYLIAVLPLIFCSEIHNIPGFGKKISIQPVIQGDTKEECIKDIDSKKIRGLIANNVSFTFITFAVIIYLPQLVQQNGWDPRISADVNSIFFLSMIVSGIFLVPFLRFFRSLLFPSIGFLLALGIGIINFIGAKWSFYLGGVFTGLAFGVFQPLIYDKTSYAVNNPNKNIFGLSLVLTALYIAISIEPFVISGITKLFHIAEENHFAFTLSFYLGVVYILVSFIYRHAFTFSIEKRYYDDKDI